MTQVEKFIVAPTETGKRLDSFLALKLPNISRASLKKAIQNGQCKINGQIITKADYKVGPNLTIELFLESHNTKLSAETGNVEIVWHDQNVVIVNKDAGLTVHPCPSCPENTLIQRLLPYFPSLAALEGERPGIVHRLDKDTSGLLAVALTEEARLFLTVAFAKRLVHKEYLAIVYGSPPAVGTCQEPIGRDPNVKTKMAIVVENKGGRSAYTRWEKLWQGQTAALLSIKIATGRTHQIRVHMAHLGFPLLGDKVYAPTAIAELANRQMLHAFKLTLPHPTTKQNLEFVCHPPDDFRSQVINLAKECQHIIITGNPGSG